MNEHDISEYTYKNGYEVGAKDLAEMLKKEAIYFGRVVEVEKINEILKELLEKIK